MSNAAKDWSSDVRTDAVAALRKITELSCRPTRDARKKIYDTAMKVLLDHGLEDEPRPHVIGPLYSPANLTERTDSGKAALESGETKSAASNGG